ncbi:MAG: ArsA-related P-loop ATPase [Myxococcota bacterium]
MNARLRELLSRRLLIVTGKGGTGKSSVAAALGRLAAREGKRTAVIEVGDESVLPGLLGAGPSPPEGTEPREPWPVGSGLFTLRIVPEVALLEYLELQLRFRPLARRILANPGFRRLLDAAPGWRALITLGKLWHLQSLNDDGRPRWPLLIVDAPSTGHSLSFLSVPNVVLDTVRLGPLRRHTEGVHSLLRDHARTLVLPITLAEELPVTESLELCARLRALGLGLGPLIANAIETPPEIENLDRVLGSVAAHRTSAPDPAVLEPEVLRACVEHRAQRAALQRGFLERLDKESGLDLIELPYVWEGLGDSTGLGRLAESLLRGLELWEPEA